MRAALLLVLAVFLAGAWASSAAATVTGSVAAGKLTLTGDGDDDIVSFANAGIDPGVVLFRPQLPTMPAGCAASETGTGPGTRCTGITSVEFAGNGGEDRFDGSGIGDASVVAHGGPGGDALVGGPLADQLFGDAGDDQFLRSWNGGSDLLDGGSDRDELWYDGWTGPVTVVLPEPGATTTGNGPAGTSDTIRAIEDVHGGQANDILTGNSGPNVISGGMGRDTLTGGGGDDTISGHTEDEIGRAHV